MNSNHGGENNSYIRTGTRLKRVIRKLYYFIFAKLILITHYDRKFLKGSKYFIGEKRGKFSAPGWQWVVDDHIACKRLRVNRDIPWPVSARIHVIKPDNIHFSPDDLNNFQGFGSYFQGIGEITIGKGTFIAPNVGLITANHDVNDLDSHSKSKPIVLGDRCWIGMNSVVLPGVRLGSNTIVGAGSIVTKSFEQGNCIIAGNPAKVIRYLDTENLDDI